MRTSLQSSNFAIDRGISEELSKLDVKEYKVMKAEPLEKFAVDSLLPSS